MALTSLMRDPVHLQAIINGVVFNVAEPRVFSHCGGAVRFVSAWRSRALFFSERPLFKLFISSLLRISF